MLEPLADYLEETSSGKRPVPRLRPPGAVEESRFAETCQRCGKCVEVCPARAIVPVDESLPDASTPVIDPDRAACVVCDGLQCTHVCPSGALRPLQEAAQIRMGLAEVYPTLCVRAEGEACTICVDRCPLGEQAIRFDDEGPPTVLQPGCVGCGVCQLYCPTDPKAIIVLPWHVLEKARPPGHRQESPE